MSPAEGKWTPSPARTSVSVRPRPSSSLAPTAAAVA
eukprot:CAMPEP_0183473466 /NCGR_PEP_ID=MMETSP0370-20130417/161364_1 /TAXON_ID=268820 /ORGANISM="Peridinium aciculiferum, Strain PAER-2" /LENGTH=35 /DNA_ID= /DNA_START= /DNA_END= /DNA_ORIENTATION=